jgi:hypothetical protein
MKTITKIGIAIAVVAIGFHLLNRRFGITKAIAVPVQFPLQFDPSLIRVYANSG